jgi:HAD superfamily hydrolase (TIGR01509 family)
MSSELEAVLFDLDGTLIDSSRAICKSFNRALTNHGLTPLPAETIRHGIGRPLKELFSEEGKGVPVESLVAEYKRSFSELAPGQSRLLPGAVELLEPLSNSKMLGIVTSRSSEGSARLLGEFGLLDYFSALVGVEDTPNGKPDPAPVFLALEKLGVQPSCSVFVGDTAFDMEAGKRAGTLTIGITTGAHSKEELLEAGADIIVADLLSLRFLVGPDDSG